MKNTLKTIMGAALVTSMVMSCPVAAKAKKGKIKSVKVSNLPAKTLTLKKGKSKTLKFKVTKSGKISKALAYKSSNKKIVTVSKKGKVTAKKKGKAKVTAYAKANKKKKVVITVTVGTPVSKIKLNKKKATLNVKKTLKLKATVTPKKASNKKVLWKTSNKKIATVSSAGKVTAKKAGKATITATAADGSGKKATAKITVKKAVIVYNVASLNVTDPYTVTFSLNKAQALDKSQVTLESKTTEQANYRNTLKIKSLTTTDNINYTVRLKDYSAIDNRSEDHNVKITVTGLMNNKAPSVLETLFRKGKITKTVNKTLKLRIGHRVSEYLSNANDGSHTYEVSALPAGLKRDPDLDGVYVYGTPTVTTDQAVTVKETDPYGNTYTTNWTIKFYNKDQVAVDNIDDYEMPSIDSHGTADLNDDTVSPVYISKSLDVDGGQYYTEHKAATYKDVDQTYTDKDGVAHKVVKTDKDKKVPTGKITVTVDKAKVKKEDLPTVFNGEYTHTFDATDLDALSKSGAFVTKDDALVKDDAKTVNYKDGDKDFSYYDENNQEVHAYKMNDGYTAEYNYDVKQKQEIDTPEVVGQEAKYTVVSGNTNGLTVDEKTGSISGNVSSDTSFVVQVEKKNSAGQPIYAQASVNIHVASATLVKGTITSNNARAVPDANVSYVDNDLSSNFSSSDYGYYTNTDGQYERLLRNGTTYDVMVAKNGAYSYYANQTPAATMNYTLNANVYDVTLNNQTGETYYNNDLEYYYFYDDNTNDIYSLSSKKDGGYVLVTDESALSLTNTDSDTHNETLTLANGAATATITKK